MMKLTLMFLFLVFVAIILYANEIEGKKAKYVDPSTLPGCGLNCCAAGICVCKKSYCNSVLVNEESSCF
uniref:Uncharacterized protein n=1 Tax=Meloidogyne enterolobii TaxID=390850 RepID=A0A6V7UX08_MELEN|nr:unnamed protein product [Meloidogyne enterolobii]